MKELSIEEKAKRYDEALERARQINDEHRAQCADVMVKVFPELAESEDEKIRKALISFLKSPFVNENITDEKVTPWIAWLEKQGQDGKVWFYRDDYVRDKKQAYQDGIDNVLNNPQKYGLENQGEQKTIDEIAKEVCKNKASAAAFLKSAGIINEKGELAEQYRQSEQKPIEWSKEDEKLYQSALWHIKNSCGNQGKTSGEYEVYHFVKSLKDRIQPQPKTEWSEKDEAHIKSIISTIECSKAQFPNSIAVVEAYNSDLDWLKSLKPQNRWKPSEEQMKALYDSIPGNVMEISEREMLLNELYKDLKKL